MSENLMQFKQEFQALTAYIIRNEFIVEQIGMLQKALHLHDNQIHTQAIYPKSPQSSNTMNQHFDTISDSQEYCDAQDYKWRENPVRQPPYCIGHTDTSQAWIKPVKLKNNIVYQIFIPVIIYLDADNTFLEESLPRLIYAIFNDNILEMKLTERVRYHQQLLNKSTQTETLISPDEFKKDTTLTWYSLFD